MGNYVFSREKYCVPIAIDIFDRLAKTKLLHDNEKASKTIMDNCMNSDIVEAFTLFFVFLLKSDYKGTVEISMNRLLYHYFTGSDKGRSEDYKKINRYLCLLKSAGIIDYSGDYYTGKDFIQITLIAEKGRFRLISCVNEGIINADKKENFHAAFAVHCLLNIKNIRGGEFEPVEISQERIADCLGISVGKVRESIEFLHKKGWIGKSLQQYYTTPDGRPRIQCYNYTVHDYDKPINTEKAVIISERQKARQSQRRNDLSILKRMIVEDYDNTPILIVGQHYVEMLDNLFETDYEFKRRLYYRYPNDSDSACSLKEELLGIDESNGRFLVIVLPKSKSQSISVQHSLLKFVEENKIPKIILAEEDYIIEPFLARMKKSLKMPHRKIHQISSMPIHKGYYKYGKTHEHYSTSMVLKFSVENCVELLIPEITNKHNQSLTRRTDTLISRLSGGKTYFDILKSQDSFISNIPKEVKYLSLAIRRRNMKFFQADIGKLLDKIN